MRQQTFEVWILAWSNSNAAQWSKTWNKTCPQPDIFTVLLCSTWSTLVLVIIQYLSHTDLLSHRFDPPVLGLSGRRVGRSCHLHLTGVSRETVGAAVETRQKVLQRYRKTPRRYQWSAPSSILLSFQKYFMFPLQIKSASNYCKHSSIVSLSLYWKKCRSSSGFKTQRDESVGCHTFIQQTACLFLDYLDWLVDRDESHLKIHDLNTLKRNWKQKTYSARCTWSHSAGESSIRLHVVFILHYIV